jgi:hypothetical protein
LAGRIRSSAGLLFDQRLKTFVGTAYRLIRMASCITLGSVNVLVMLPNAAEPKLPFG